MMPLRCISFRPLGAVGLLLAMVPAAVVSGQVGAPGSVGAAERTTPPTRLRLAFASNRNHYWYPRILVYDHDGHSSGRIALTIPGPEKRLDHQPTLNANGTSCVFGWEAEGGVGKLQLWDLAKNAAGTLTEAHQSPNALFSPSLSADGTLLAYTAWNRPGSSSRWDVQLLDLQTGQMVPLPGLNSQIADERRVSLSGNGRWLAFTTNLRGGKGLTDLQVYDRQSHALDTLDEANSPFAENYPSLSRDGRWLAFTSDRDDSQGGTDVYLFDRVARKMTALPGLNSSGQEQSPSISPSGRYLAFVSERFPDEIAPESQAKDSHGKGSAPPEFGEHDIFLYDRNAKRLLVTPGALNTPKDEYDPTLIELPESPE